MNFSTFLLVTTIITGAGFGEGAKEQTLDFRDVQVEELNREYVLSLNNCKDIAFGRGMREVSNTNADKKVMLNINNIVYVTSPLYDSVDFKERKFLDVPETNKASKSMSVKDYNDKYRVEVAYGNRNAILIKKKVMECVEVKK